MRILENESVNLFKRLAGSFLVLLLTVFVVVNPVVAYGAEGATIAVESPGAVAPGEEFTVQVSIENNPGFAGAAFQFTFDSNALELIGFGKEGSIASSVTGNPITASVSFISGADMTNNGVLFSAIFRAKPEAVNGNYNIKIGLVNDSALNLVNSKYEALSVEFNAGSVQISSTATKPDSSKDDKTSKGTNITAKAPDGSQIEFLLRDSGNSREYSFDNGVTWKSVPGNGIITTPEGKSLSIDASQDADYVVESLPAGLSGEKESLAGTIPLPLLIGIAAVIVVLLIIVAMRLRSNAAKKAYKKMNNASRASKQEKGRTNSETRVRSNQATTTPATDPQVSKERVGRHHR